MRNRRSQNWTETLPYSMLLNYLHTFVFDIFSVFSTPYLHNEPQILASYIYNIGTIRKTLVPGVHYSFACLFKLQFEATLLKKMLWHRCFSVNLAKFPRTPFYRIPQGDCFYNYQSRTKFSEEWLHLERTIYISNRPYHFRFFKGFIPQISVHSLNTLFNMSKFAHIFS